LGLPAGKKPSIYAAFPWFPLAFDDFSNPAKDRYGISRQLFWNSKKNWSNQIR